MEEDMGLSFDSTIKVKDARIKLKIPVFGRKKKAVKMPSNYPPEISGSNLFISGADKEWEEESTCSKCHYNGFIIKESYGKEIYWSCPSCNNASIEIDSF